MRVSRSSRNFISAGDGPGEACGAVQPTPLAGEGLSFGPPDVGKGQGDRNRTGRDHKGLAGVELPAGGTIKVQLGQRDVQRFGNGEGVSDEAPLVNRLNL